VLYPGSGDKECGQLRLGKFDTIMSMSSVKEESRSVHLHRGRKKPVKVVVTMKGILWVIIGHR
jgi:hypothetical protein